MPVLIVSWPSFWIETEYTKMPIWILFFALGFSSNKEVGNLIDADAEDSTIVNISKECQHYHTRAETVTCVTHT